MLRLLVFVLSLFIAVSVSGQGTGYGLSGGLTIATQNWNNQQREPLFTYNADVFIEFMSNWSENKKNTRRSAFILMLGHHKKGNSIRYNYTDRVTGQITNVNADIIFNNITLMPGIKSSYQLNERSIRAFYLVGFRLEYTFDKKFEVYESLNSEEVVNRFNYGLTVGGGIEFGPEDGQLNYILSAEVSPDISRQLFVPPGTYRDRSGYTYTFPELSVRNLSFELKLGIRINKFVEYEEVEEEKF